MLSWITENKDVSPANSLTFEDNPSDKSLLYVKNSNICIYIYIIFIYIYILYIYMYIYVCICMYIHHILYIEYIEY